MSGRLKKYILEIETHGPVHIGNGEKHSPYEFVYQPESNRLGMLNEGKWLKYLKNNKLYEKYEKDALSRDFKVYNWMRNNSIEPWNIDVYRYVIDGVEQDKEKGLNDVSCVVKNYKGEPYIPGSSIKGVLRTAILCCHLSNNKGKYEYDWNLISNSVKNGKERDIKKCIESLEEKCFGNLPWKDEGKRPQRQLVDVFRAVLVSDTTSVPAESITVVQKNDWGKKSVDSGRTLPLWRETIKKNIRLRFDLTMDFNMLNSCDIGIAKIEDVLGMLNYYYEDVLMKFEAYFKVQGLDEIYSSKDKPLVYLGGGAGFHTKSILYSLAPDMQSASRLVAEHLDRVFKGRHKHVITDTNVSPRTIKLAKTQHGLSKMGICSIKVVDEVACVN
ncbi:MAG: type III-A CRISPR-associated RAMP protein Csm5 [Clostridiaceae bacterium]|nr:type III-A CRISPR-associated RAMP protein Csm5 [Clostridiaceae bacterium]